MKWCSTSVRQTTNAIEFMAQPNCNDQIAARAFGATVHVDPRNFEMLKTFDVVFATMWKVCTREFESRWMEVLHRLKDETETKVVLFQEAETAWATTRPWDEQKSFIELLGKVDLFLTHNERDIEYWGAFRKNKPTYRWPTCLDIEVITKFRVDPDDKPTKPILCGSSYDQRANGLAALIACKEMGYPLWHQNRSTGYEDRTKELPELLGVKIEKEIPHSNWEYWLREIAGAYIAVHPMPAAAAGRDQIAFAALGIPCVGNWELDLQRHLFGGEMTADPFDVKAIRECVDTLLSDRVAYEEVRYEALQNVKYHGLPYALVMAKGLKDRMGWQ